MYRCCLNLCRRTPHAFTLIELVVVILVLGILAAVAAPRLVGTSSDATTQAFVRQLLVFHGAVERYYVDHQAFPPDSSTSVMPPELDPYMRANEYGKATPIGGRWDYARSAYGIIAGVGVHFVGGSGFPGAAKMVEIDSIVDDGNLNTGIFQRRDGGARFYMILR